jgi:ferredoxin-fold anticodon binding domain-containing protein
MIDIQNLTLRQINEIKNINSTINHEDICASWLGRYVIIRTYSAGVHFGILSKKIGNEVILTNSRRIWSWEGAFTLSKISEDGLTSKSRLSVEIPEIKLTEIEIIPCSEKCIKSLKEIKEYMP